MAEMMANDIAAKIESEMEYPGQIKVTVLREFRATSVRNKRLARFVFSLLAMCMESRTDAVRAICPGFCVPPNPTSAS